MGLNLDVSHVAFAGLSKFDGKRHRRLTISEMAQIAGRAGRHQRDGTFGTVQLGTESETLFEPAEIGAVKGPDFDPLTNLEWSWDERCDGNERVSKCRCRWSPQS